MEIKKHYASLSDAIRVGATIRPQCRGDYFNEGGSCALGAAAEAIFGDAQMGAWIDEDLFPYVDDKIDCPVCSMADEDVTALIPHLNDVHEWTREAIADWLHEYEDSIGYVTLVEQGVNEPANTWEPSLARVGSCSR